jgi:hypothetical protein
VAIREYEALVSRAKAGDWSGFLVDLLARQSLDDLKKHANSVVSQLVICEETSAVILAARSARASPTAASAPRSLPSTAVSVSNRR